MVLFKKSVDVLDIPALQKRGIAKKTPEKNYNLAKNLKDGYLDLAALSENKQAETLPLQAKSTSSVPFDFLDSLSTASQPSTTSSSSTTQNSPNTGNSELSDLKIKLENLEYQLERFLERVDKIESKMEEYERKRRPNFD